MVLHASPLSSTLVTRALATFAEVAWIYPFSHVIRLLNLDHVAWVHALSWLMVLAVVTSQFLVWGAILTGRLSLYFYEELGWAVIFVANTVASAYLYGSLEQPGGGTFLLQLSLLFGLVYLPWQFIHLRASRADAGGRDGTGEGKERVSGALIANRMRAAAARARNSHCQQATSHAIPSSAGSFRGSVRPRAVAVNAAFGLRRPFGTGLHSPRR